jgi:hypothetical protein
MTAPKPVRFFYDTEFIEDGKTIDLISIGIVREDGAEFYAVNHEADWARIHAHTWLESNVVPHLPDGADKAWQSRDQIAAGVHAFLTSNGQKPAELWAHYSAYDHVVLAQLFGPMIDLPRGIPMFTNDTQALAHQLGVAAHLPKQHGANHDALQDARHVKVTHDYLEQFR